MSILSIVSLNSKLLGMGLYHSTKPHALLWEAFHFMTTESNVVSSLDHPMF